LSEVEQAEPKKKGVRRGEGDLSEWRVGNRFVPDECDSYDDGDDDDDGKG
jgi:hypothetical protein